jgi:flagellar protein FlbD
MIILTRLNGERFALNPDLLERVDSTPDTVLTLLGGTKYVVGEPMETVIERVREFRAGVISASHVPLAPVPDLDDDDHLDGRLADDAVASGAVPLRPRRRS